MPETKKNAPGTPITGSAAVADKPASPAKAPAKAPTTPKTTLRDMPIGSKDGTQVLVDKFGDYQLWKSEKTGKFGLIQVVNNKYVTKMPVRNEEKVARDMFESLRPKTSAN